MDTETKPIDRYKLLRRELPFELQKKFMMMIMEKYSIIDLRKLDKQVFNTEVMLFVVREKQKMLPFNNALDEMIKQLNIKIRQ